MFSLRCSHGWFSFQLRSVREILELSTSTRIEMSLCCQEPYVMTQNHCLWYANILPTPTSDPLEAQTFSDAGLPPPSAPHDAPLHENRPRASRQLKDICSSACQLSRPPQGARNCCLRSRSSWRAWGGWSTTMAAANGH